MKFKFVNRFYCKGKKWVIKFVDTNSDHLDNGGAHAATDTNNRIMYIDKELKYDKIWLEKWVLHELWHVAFFESHLHQCSELNTEVEEIMCETFADTVLETLKKYFYK